MHTRSHFLLFLGTLLFCSWPAALFAYVPVQPLKPPQLQPSFTSSFFLVASRKLADPRFRETVVLVTRIGHRGPTGIIVNRPRDITLDKVFPAYPAARDIRLFAGGPVNPGQISYLFRGGEAVAGTLKVSGQVYLAYNRSLLGELLGGTRPHSGLRVVNGLAGWAPGQLEKEIARGDWYTLPVDDEAIFDHPAAEMWIELLHRATTISR